MWIDTRDCVPLTDGEYLVQTIYGEVKPLDYTHEGGWNTHYEGDKLFGAYAIRNDYVARWYKVDNPPAVPKAWKEEYLKGGE
jgi:hypothetical protein